MSNSKVPKSSTVSVGAHTQKLGAWPFFDWVTVQYGKVSLALVERYLSSANEFVAFAT